jgi:L-alanine-DL-glutamate epimerase-like enolase superfamily enzyme
MRIKSISLYSLEVPLAQVQHLSRGREFRQFQSTFIKIETDENITGWGEVCPWGASYLPAFPGGVQTAIAELAPQLIGMDPRRPEVINRHMDTVLTGHIYAKAGIDYALWDIIGKACNLPVYELLGGKEDHNVPLSYAIHVNPLEIMLADLERKRSQGVTRFSVKVGNDYETDVSIVRAFAAKRLPHETFIYDANTGWAPMDAIRVMNSVSDVDACFEQPCMSYDQCMNVRSQTRQALCLDECLVDLKDFARAFTDRSCEIVNIKLARVGGITKARAIRDLCLSYDVKMLIMCMAGTVVNDTVSAHFAQSIPSNRLIGTWSCQELITVDPAPGRGARASNGFMTPPDLPGLGVEPDLELLGESVAVFN